MEISLIRHGRSKHIDKKRVACSAYQDWVKKYDSSGVFEEEQYPLLTLEKITQAGVVITSDLTRSIESAKLLQPKSAFLSDPLFREVELPILPGNQVLRLSPSSWAFILRCLWFCGYSRQCESLHGAKNRAKRAADQLVRYTKGYQSVVLVGHGFFNRFIAEELKNMGWNGKRRSSTKHWGCTTYKFG